MGEDASRDMAEQTPTRADLDEIVSRYLPRLHAYVRHNMGHALRAREASVDVVQSICREVLEQRENFSYQGEAQFISWLLTTAMNKIRERARYLSRKKRDPAREQAGGLDVDPAAYASLITPSEELARSEQLAELEAAIQRLPEDYREVVVLARILGLPHAEIAQHMGRTPGATRTLLGRAMTRLASELGQDS